LQAHLVTEHFRTANANDKAFLNCNSEYYSSALRDLGNPKMVGCFLPRVQVIFNLFLGMLAVRWLSPTMDPMDAKPLNPEVPVRHTGDRALPFCLKGGELKTKGGEFLATGGEITATGGEFMAQGVNS
jgi:hypothetical protein